MQPIASENGNEMARSLCLRPLSQLLNEIMPMIYKRFTEKSAEEWRQIYKVQRKTVALLHLRSNVRCRVFNSSNSSSKTVQSGSLMMHDHICHC